VVSKPAPLAEPAADRKTRVIDALNLHVIFSIQAHLAGIFQRMRKGESHRAGNQKNGNDLR
jgi:hypothetical protein